MKIPPERIGLFDGKTCFICGKYLLNNTPADLAYVPNATGKSIKALPDKYYLFSCPNCKQVAHKRCWYKYGEQKRKKGIFGGIEWQLQCPSCGRVLSPERETLTKWNKGYEIPGHPDQELIELHIRDILAWKAGSVFGKIGAAIGSFFQAVGLGSLTDAETNAVGAAAAKMGRSINDVAERVFRLNITPEERRTLTALTCQNCGAPLPMPEYWESAAICTHCGTAHLLPT